VVHSLTLPARSTCPYGPTSPGVAPAATGAPKRRRSRVSGGVRLAGTGTRGGPHGRLRRGYGFGRPPTAAPPRAAFCHSRLDGNRLPAIPHSIAASRRAIAVIGHGGSLP
jgi:hypothetical protein